MTRRSFMLPVLAVTILPVPLQAASQYVSCEIVRSASVSFRDNQSDDILTVSISGQPCHEALLVIEITSRSGDKIYHYQTRFKPHVTIHRESPKLAEAARRFVDDVFESGFSQSSQLPESFIPDNPNVEPIEFLEVQTDAYAKVRAVDRPTFTHGTQYRGWRTLAWDPDLKSVVIVVTGGY